MGVLSTGRIQLTPFRISSSEPLEVFKDAAWAARYPEDAIAGAAGWGSTNDDPEYLNQPVPLSLRVGKPDLLNATDTVPARLRLRFYWHTLERKALRFEQGRDDWRRSHLLHGADIIIFDDDSGVRTGIVSLRDTGALRSKIFPALRDMVQGADKIGMLETDSLPEAFEPDFFKWLLYRSQGTTDLGSGLAISSMTELAAKGDSGGTKFTEETALERIELAAAVAVGRRSFGPAKVALAVEGLALWLALDLHLDGGFAVSRQSLFDAPEGMPKAEQGYWLAEQVWSAVLPKLRHAYRSDVEWISVGSKDFEAQAIVVICKTLKLLGVTSL